MATRLPYIHSWEEPSEEEQQLTEALVFLALVDPEQLFDLDPAAPAAREEAAAVLGGAWRVSRPSITENADGPSGPFVVIGERTLGQLGQALSWRPRPEVGAPEIATLLASRA